MAQPEITYGSAGVPVPPVTPFEALNAASPSIRMGSCEVRVGRTEFAGVAAAGGPVAIGRTRPAEVRAAKTKKAETFDGRAASPSTMQKGGTGLIRSGWRDGWRAKRNRRWISNPEPGGVESLHSHPKR